MRTLILFVLLSLFSVGCGPRYVDFFPCHSDGTPKPRISFVPVFDCTQRALSQEFTERMTVEFRNNGNLYLLYPHEVEEDLERVGNPNFFGSDLSFARAFRDTDYVLLVEFIEHRPLQFQELKNYFPSGCKHPCGMLNNVLLMKVRLRIIDVRCQPIVIHQEILTNDFIMPCQIDNFADAYKLFAEQTARRVEQILGKRYG